MRAAKVDTNHARIVQALRAAGWQVVSTARMGGGFPDLVCARHGEVRLVEVKLAAGKLTKGQVSFHDAFPVVVVRTIEDAVRMR